MDYHARIDVLWKQSSVCLVEATGKISPKVASDPMRSSTTSRLFKKPLASSTWA
jgi:hypothetical protein